MENLLDLKFLKHDRQRNLSGAEKDLRAVACAHVGKYRKAEGNSQQDGCCGFVGSSRF